MFLSAFEVGNLFIVRKEQFIKPVILYRGKY